MKERIAILDGIRTPMGKAGGILKNIGAEDLGAFVVREIMERTEIDPNSVDELIFGNVAQPAHAANIARVLALKAGLPISLPAYTVHRNCASGMEAITTGANKINAGDGKIIIAGGTENMSQIPLLFNKQMTKFFENLFRAKTLVERLKVFTTFRLGHLAPIIGVSEGLTDPISGMIMGNTAEVLAREFHITREEQDQYALNSHLKALAAIDNGIFAQEILPIPLLPDYKVMIDRDEGPRVGQNIEALAKLKPYFDRRNGTVTVGNACPITDGAAALVLMSESQAKKEKRKVLGYLTDFAYASLEPQRMGLGPIYAASKLFQKSKFKTSDFDLIEINEAFAAQVIGNLRAWPSKAFAEKYLDRDKALGEIDPAILNVNGGAIALGHPVGMTGARLVIHTLKELRRRNKNLGLASLCIGGGQGAALALEVE